MSAPGFDIRPATADDTAAVTRLLAVSYPTAMKPAYDAEVLKAALPLMVQAQPDLLSCGTYFVLQQDDGEIIGCGGWTREQPGDGEIFDGIGHVRHVAVRPDLTGNGVGRAIMTLTEATAMAASIKGLECISTLNAAPFYSALGYETVQTGEVKIGGSVWLPSVLMRKRIG